jgi:hypothetical protein
VTALEGGWAVGTRSLCLTRCCKRGAAPRA